MKPTNPIAELKTEGAKEDDKSKASSKAASGSSSGKPNLVKLAMMLGDRNRADVRDTAKIQHPDRMGSPKPFLLPKRKPDGQGGCPCAAKKQ